MVPFINPRAQSIIGNAHTFLGRAYVLENRIGKSLQSFRKAISVFENLDTSPISMANTDYLEALNGYVMVLSKENRVPEARETLHTAIEVGLTAYEIDHNRFGADYARILLVASLVEEQSGNFDEATDYAELALEHVKPLAKAAPIIHGQTYIGALSILCDLNRTATVPDLTG